MPAPEHIKGLNALFAEELEAAVRYLHLSATVTGLDRLLARCAELAVDDHLTAELLVPHHRYDVIGKLHELGTVRSQESLDDGVRLSGRFPLKHRTIFEPFVVTPTAPAKPAKKFARVRS